MAEKGQRAANETVRAQLLADAYSAGEKAVCRHTLLRGDDARRVAVEAVDAARPKLISEYTAGVTASGPQTVAVAAAAVAVLGADLAVFAAVAVRRTRRVRGLAAAAFVGHLGLYTYARYRAARIRTAARARIAADTATR
jgi:hypothetical protein